MTSCSISIYENIKDIESKRTVPLDILLEYIKEGRWQDSVLNFRITKFENEEERKKVKSKFPCVTIAGQFEKRYDSKLVKHSGYLSIDFDDLENPEELKQKLSQDRYCVAAFVSVSGRGLCAIFKINPEKHREAFQGLCQYLFEKYGHPCDPTSINLSRARYISFDSNIYINPDTKVEKFAQYPKSKPPKKVEKVVYAEDDFSNILKQIVSRRLNLTEDYHDWLRICFSIVHQFQEGGRNYFHAISQFSAKYDSNICDKQYNSCLKHKGTNEVTIATFYYYCKSAGIEIYSERTRKIIYSASNGKKGGLNPSQVSENLKKFEGIEFADDVIKQAFESNIEAGEDNLLEQLEIWMKQNYDLRRNLITRYIECNGQPLKQKDFNSIFIKGKKIFDKLSFELIDRLINSDFIQEYNPFHEFFNNNDDIESDGNIEKIFSCLKGGDVPTNIYFGMKWIVGVVASMHGQHSSLMLVLSGETQNTGKTEFFRRLLPQELFSYYAESKLDAGTDDEILMTQKIIIMDDEMGGKSKKESKRLKELTSKQWFSLREPYGRSNVDLLRIAVLCGTTNDNELLNDTTGNRRILPINVTSVDQELYNSVNKTELLMEAYRLWKSGFEWRMSRDDIKLLGQYSTGFEVSTSEAELIMKYYELPEPGDLTVFLTATDIKVYIEIHSKQRLSLDAIGKQLKKLGFQQEHIKVGKSTKRCYIVKKVDNEKDNPF